ncbi:MAG: hypothetical protein J4F36_12780 [Nitrosopumilaceae archaeon]|nr:hypothetical protein [Nitrosopumilaceae archaeon]
MAGKKVAKKIVKKVKTKKKTAKKSARTKSISKTKSKEPSMENSGIIIIEDDLEIDQDKLNEERKAYLEEARSQEAID